MLQESPLLNINEFQTTNITYLQYFTCSLCELFNAACAWEEMLCVRFMVCYMVLFCCFFSFLLKISLATFLSFFIFYYRIMKFVSLMLQKLKNKEIMVNQSALFSCKVLFLTSPPSPPSMPP